MSKDPKEDGDVYSEDRRNDKFLTELSLESDTLRS